MNTNEKLEVRKVNSPSTTRKGGRDRASIESPVEPKRARKPSAAQRAVIERQEDDCDRMLKAVTEEVEDLMIDMRPSETAEDLSNDVDELLTNRNTRRMYARYQQMWVTYVKDNNVSEECDDQSLRNFFKTLRGRYAPSTLWVIYSCVNHYFIEKHGKNLKSYPRLNKYLKGATEKYVATKSKVFSPEQMDAILSFCALSDQPDHHLLGVAVAIMYYGLLRISDLMNVNVEDVKMLDDKKTEITFEHTRKRRNPGFTFNIPPRYIQLFVKYDAELAENATGRYVKNYNKKSKKRSQPCGKHKAEGFVKRCCAILDISSTDYTSHAFRRSAATNLADAGVSLINLKRHGQWKSDKVVEEYLANSKPLRKERMECLMPQTKAPPHPPSRSPPREEEQLVELGTLVKHDANPEPLSQIGFSQLEDCDIEDCVFSSDIDGRPIVCFEPSVTAKAPPKPDSKLRTTPPAHRQKLEAPHTPPAHAKDKEQGLAALLGAAQTIFSNCSVTFNINAK